jgi:Derlin-2/3
MSIYLPKHAIPRHRRPNPLSTPSRFRRLFPRQGRMGQASAIQTRSTATATGRQTAAPDSDAFQAARHRWGTGNRLGGEGL